MTTIGNIGIGLFILIIIWILALIIFVIGVKYQSNIAWLALSFAAIFTFILILIPTEKLKKIEETQILEKDYIILYKKLITAFLWLSALFGGLVFFLSHCIEPIRPKLLTK